MPEMEVLIPSQIRRGEWWEWGTFDGMAEAVAALREAGIPVDDRGRLFLVTAVPCSYCESEEHATHECPDELVWDAVIRLEKLAIANDLQAEDLDELVHEVVSKDASDVNNGGLEDQLEFLVKAMGEKAVSKALVRIWEEKNPDTV